VGWGCGAQERERWCVERQDLMGKIPIYKSLRSARTEPRTPTSKKANRVTPFVSGISALRELLDKTMSKPYQKHSRERSAPFRHAPLFSTFSKYLKMVT
jgi:hypothetical protein